MSMGEKHRVLFVDDETRVLDGLRRSLRGARNEWEMTFLEGGAPALEAMEQGEPFDILVTDMRMPGMDGAALLEAVQERFPATIRIILSGHAEHELALKSATCAHQFLSKPCEASHLRAVVTRCLRVRQGLESEAGRALLGGIDSLPSMPIVFTKLRAALADPDVALGAVSRIVSEDPALSAKILQLVNSSFFGMARSIRTIDQAVSYLGLTNLVPLCFNEGILREFDERSVAPGFDFEGYREHSVLVAQLAAAICDSGPELDGEAFLCGLLHDFGQLVAASCMQDEYHEWSEGVARIGGRHPDLERQVFGLSLGEVGSYLLGIWGLPNEVVTTTQLVTAPAWTAEEPASPVLAATHLAVGLLGELEGAPGTCLDLNFIEAAGLTDRIEASRALARSMTEIENDAAA